MIAIPHGLAAEVLRALQDGPRTTGQIVDAIDKARGIVDDEPGAGFSPVWSAAIDLCNHGMVTRSGGLISHRTWELRR